MVILAVVAAVVIVMLCAGAFVSQPTGPYRIEGSLDDVDRKADIEIGRTIARAVDQDLQSALRKRDLEERIREVGRQARRSGNQ